MLLHILEEKDNDHLTIINLYDGYDAFHSARDNVCVCDYAMGREDTVYVTLHYLFSLLHVSIILFYTSLFF